MADYDSALPVRTQLVDGATVVATQDVFLVGGTDGSNYQALSTDASGYLNVNATMSWDDTNKIVITDGTEDLAINADGSINVIATITAGQTIGLEAGTESIGSVDINAGQTVGIDAGTASIGTVGLDAGSNVIGVVGLDTGAEVVLAAGTASIGSVDINAGQTVGLDAGTADIGVVHLTDGTTELDVAVDGATAKTNGIQILGTDGTNAQILSTDSNGWLNVNADSSPLNNSIVYGSVTAVKDTPVTVVSQAGAAVASGIQASGSGLMKVEVKYGVTASEATTIVLYNSTANPNVSYEFPQGFEVAALSTLLISVTNLERTASTASDFTAHATILLEA